MIITDLNAKLSSGFLVCIYYPSTFADANTKCCVTSKHEMNIMCTVGTNEIMLSTE